MRKMRTAKEMREYYRENRGSEPKMGFFKDLFDRDGLCYYERAESLLESEEYVLTFFWGYTYVYEAAPKEQRWIYLLTNKRLIAKCMSGHGWQIIDYKKLKGIETASTGADVFFDTDGWYRGLSDVGLYLEDVEYVRQELAEVMPYIREIQEKEAQRKRFSGSPADEIRKFKELWDDGIITEEEFEQKKKKLLDL